MIVVPRSAFEECGGDEAAAEAVVRKAMLDAVAAAGLKPSEAVVRTQYDAASGELRLKARPKKDEEL